MTTFTGICICLFVAVFCAKATCHSHGPTPTPMRFCPDVAITWHSPGLCIWLQSGDLLGCPGPGVANQICAADVHGGQLAVIPNDDVDDVMADLLSMFYRAWIGNKTVQTEGGYVRAVDTVFYEECIYMEPTGSWTYVTCSPTTNGTRMGALCTVSSSYPYEWSTVNSPPPGPPVALPVSCNPDNTNNDPNTGMSTAGVTETPSKGSTISGFQQTSLTTWKPRCKCKCRHQNNATAELDVAEMTKNIRSNLIIGREMLSSTKRRKTSANDKRPSARVTGCIGVLILVAIIGSVVIVDSPRFLSWLKKCNG